MNVQFKQKLSYRKKKLNGIDTQYHATFGMMKVEIQFKINGHYDPFIGLCT